jgi:acyl-CoA thioester hydrolase
MGIEKQTIYLKVRYAETDQGGMAHHSVYPVWFEMGRVELLTKTGITYREMELDGFFFVIVELHVRYHRPARFDEKLELETRLTDMTKVTMKHGYLLTRSTDGELLAEGSTLVACTNRNGRPCRIPKAALDAIGNRDS